MSANNTEMNMIIAEVVPDVEATAIPELPVTMAELLEEDFGSDDEAEFLQGVLEIQVEIENVILSDTPEDFLLPTEDNLPPALLLLEKLDELKGYKFADRTLARMERRVRGENEVVRTFVSETDKINNPAYKKCPLCERHFTIRYLGRHIGNEVCKKVSVAQGLRPADNKHKKVSDKIYAACLDLEDLIARSVQYKKNIEPELEEEEVEEEVYGACIECGNEGKFIGKEGDEWTCEVCLNGDEEEDNNKVYTIKTYEYNYKAKAVEYAGLWEDENGNKEFKTEEEAREQFEYATEGDKGFIYVEIVEIDPDSENREKVIDDWEDNIDDYVEEEEEEVEF